MSRRLGAALAPRTEAGGILFSKVCGLEGAEDGDENVGTLE